MRKFLVTAVFAVALLGMLSPPVFAQAPAPKVNITGVFDQVTSAGRNFYDGNYGRTSDQEWYARTRFRPDFSFEVGRTKAVLGLEIDLCYGQSGANDGGFPGNNTGATTAHRSCNGGLDLNTDVGGVLEVKWIYTEFDLTGKDSLLPFIPVPTVARLGGQPFATLGNYKVAYANGDFAGISAVTTFAPNLKVNLAYVMVEDANAGSDRGNNVVAVNPGLTPPTTVLPGSKSSRGDDFAFIISPEYTVYKGLDIKPLYSYFYAEGTTSGNARRSAVSRGLGGATNGTTAAPATYAATVAGTFVGVPGGVTDPPDGGSYASGSPSLKESRHTLGVDASWRMGPWGLDPTVYYQWGKRDVQCACPVSGSGFTVREVETDVSAWLIDVIGSYQVGPLLLEARGIYSTGNKARDNLARRISYFEPLDTDSSYYAGWASILALGVDYFNGGGGDADFMSSNVGYDRYGRAQIGLRATYYMTPALAFYGVLSPTWTAEKVDTHTGMGASGTTAGIRTIIDDKSFAGVNDSEQSRYIGTEADLGLTWKFAPNTAFDLGGAWLFAGKALDTFEILNGVATRREAKDAWTVASRVRLSF